MTVTMAITALRSLGRQASWLFGEAGVIAFGVTRGGNGETLCGSINVVDDVWHHIAVTRSADTGLLSLYVDGVLDGTVTGPTGDVSYRDGRASSYPNDPYLVIGAEKHDYDPVYPSYSGWLDELRISTSVRYTEDFTPPTIPLAPDADHSTCPRCRDCRAISL